MKTVQGFARIMQIVLWCIVLAVGAYVVGIWYMRGETAVPDKERPFRETAWEKLRTWTWQSYANQEYGFGIKFPAHWAIEEQEVSGEWPEWRMTRPSGLFRIALRRGAPACDAPIAFTYLFVDASRVPLCEGDADDILQYILELPHDDLTFSLSCDYTLSLRTCSRLFATFKTITPHAKYRLFIERNISADAVRLAIQKPDSVTYLPNGAVKCLKCLDEGELVVVYAKEKSVYVIVTAYFK